ncbi:MAG: hypothetical protein R2770_14905 [Acidimicrobiales bacterium]
MISDANRRQLYESLVKSIGPESSEVLMELLPPAGWSDLVTRTDLNSVRTELKTDIEITKTELRIEIQDLRTELKGDIQHLRTELRGDIQDLRTELKSDIRGIQGQIDGQLPKVIMANIASMLAVAGTVITAGALF